MLNQYVPFPRYERAVFIGDKAAEILSALHIHAMGLIGGEIPSIERIHPYEKLLECTACAMKHKRQILFSAARKMNAEYILLEDNRRTALNPADMAEELREMGLTVRVLDVNGTPEENLRLAGKLFGEERHAERVIEDRKTRLDALAEKRVKARQRVLILLAIRQPVTKESFLFSLTERSDLSRLLSERWEILNVVSSEKHPEAMEGVTPVDDIEAFLKLNPDVICTVCDSLAATSAVSRALRKAPDLSSVPAIAKARIHHVPFWCDSMDWKDALTLEEWAEALGEE